MAERTLDSQRVEELAARLEESERTGKQISQFSREIPELAIADAYRIQNAWIEMKLRRGRKILGHKVGLTSKAMQSASQINEPDHGVLLDDMFYRDGAELPMSRFIVPRLEVELAFHLARPLRGPATIFDVLHATDYVSPALEIIDSRIVQVDPETKLFRKVTDTISDNAANAALVVGGRPVRPTEIDLRWVSALCYRNGDIEESGVAAAVLHHPANGILWLANKLGSYGVGLEAGETILCGSFTRPVFAKAGDVFHVDYGPLGSIACTFKA